MNIQEKEEKLCRQVTDYLDVFDSSDILTGPSRYFHEETLSRRKQLGTPGEAVHDTFFLQLLYATLTAWGLHRGGASKTKLVEFDEFETSLRSHAKDLDDLHSLHIQDVAAESESLQVASRLWTFMKQVHVSATASKIVAGSKVLHHLLPNLVPPIDRKYTSEFFSWHNRMQYRQEEMFKDVYPRLVKIARRLAPLTSEYIDRHPHKTLPKVVDDAIVGFVIDMERNEAPSSDEERKAKFDQLRDQLNKLKESYNPRGEDLHFAKLDRADEKLVTELVDLAKKGVAEVNRHSRYFLEEGLYADGGFWYDLFVIIGSGAVRILADRAQATVPLKKVQGLVDALVDISPFTVFLGDMRKRNYEALGNTLLAFPDEALVKRIRDRARKIGSSEVAEFIEDTIDGVESQRRRNTSEG